MVRRKLRYFVVVTLLFVRKEFRRSPRLQTAAKNAQRTCRTTLRAGFFFFFFFHLEVRILLSRW